MTRLLAAVLSAPRILAALAALAAALVARRLLCCGMVAALALGAARAYADPVSQEGLWQKPYSGWTTTADPSDGGTVVPGALLASCVADSYTYEGTTYTMGTSQTWAYSGVMLMKGGVTYRFVKNYDDNGCIIITDPLSGVATTVITSTVWNEVKYGTYTPAQDGYYPIYLAVFNGSGGLGPAAAPFNNASQLGAGLAWTDDPNVTDCTTSNYQKWHKFLNDPNGDTIFFTSAPALQSWFKVSSSPDGVGAPSPSGTTTDLADGQTVAVSCGATPWTNAAETVRYDCTGWKLYDEDGNVVSNGTETSFTYTHPDPAEYRRLEWQWEPRLDAFAGAHGWYEHRTVGTDVVLIFTNHLETSTFAVRRPVYADILTVGGGGGGGGNFGGGGGGGGVIHRQGVLLEPGVYEIAVGPGGAGNGNGRGETGGTSSVVRVAGGMRDFVQYAPGGGGGGNWVNAGGTGATGGGAGGYGTRGFGLGAEGSPGQSDVAGGGSAIDIGHAPSGGKGGAGGKGVYCDISGENDFYGWGGGGSSRTTAGSAGGGEGDPLGYGHGSGSDNAAATDGRPNHGGGAGGCRSTSKKDGGSGVVIVRWATMAEAGDGEPVIRTAGQTRIGSTSLTLAGALDDLGGAASVSVRLLYGTAPDALTRSVDLGAFTAPGAVEGTVRGLERYTDYWYCFEAAGATTVRSDTRRAKTLGFAEMTWTGLANVTTNGVYEVVSFTNGTATVTFSSPGNVDLLVVGGGGGGQRHDSSHCAGGGGGGGGVLYREGFVPIAGTNYEITVGAGGAIGTSGGAAGLIGGDSTVILGTEDILRAKGGGGGNGTGASGGGRGGNGNNGTSTDGSAWMQGYAGKGSYATEAQQKNGGGGGGAGGDGYPDSEFKGGDGGPGVMCAITGEERYYGAGGGGGGSTYSGKYPGGPGLGGSGVGGDGGGNDGSGLDGKEPAANSGSGGGGAGSWGGNPSAGADGIVVIRRRIADADDPTPQGAAELTEVGAAYAVFEGLLQDPGAMGFCDSADVYVSVVSHGGVAAWTKKVSAVEADEGFAFDVTGLSPETEYDWAVKFVNTNDVDNASWENVVASGTLTTAAKPDGAGEKPVVAFGAVVANADARSISLEYQVPWAGDGAANADVTLLWCTDGSSETNETQVAAGFVGSGAYTLSGLAPMTVYSLSLVATNDLGVVSEIAGPVLVTTRGFAPVISGIFLARGPGGDDAVTAMCRIFARCDAASSVTLDLDWGEDPAFAACETVRLMDDLADDPPMAGLVGATTIENLVLGTRYYVRVRVSNDLGLASTNTTDFLMCPRVVTNPDGTRTYTALTVKDGGTFGETVFFPGDRVVFLGEADKGFCTADVNAAVLLDGFELLCREPGVALVSGYSLAPNGDGIATNLESVLPVVVAPRAEDCPAGVWVYKKDEALVWTNSLAWIHVSGPDGNGYPDGEGVCALVYPLLSANRDVTLPASGVTVGFLGLGDAKGIANSGKITVKGGPITYSAPGTNAWLRFAGKSARSLSNVIFATTVTNRFESSTDIDFMDQVGPTTTWTAMEIPEGVVLRTVRGKYESHYTGGFYFDGAILGEGTLQFTADCYNTFSKAVETFRGTVDLVRGTAGSDHGAAGICFRFGELPLARELIVHGTYGQNGKGAFFESGQGSASGPVQKVGAFPGHVTVTGGRLNLGAPGNDQNGVGQGDYRYVITNLHLRGTMGMIDAANFLRYGTMYGATTTVFNLDVPFGPTAYLACADPVKFRLPTSPEGAFVLDETREILPYFFTHDNWVNNGLRPLYGQRIYRDRESGFCYHAVPDAVFTNEWPVGVSGDVKVIARRGGWNGTIGTMATSEENFDALLFETSEWGTPTVKFGQSSARINISSGCLSFHTGTMLGPLDNENSASALVHFGKCAYVHTLGTATVGAKLSGSNGLVKSGSGKLVLGNDSSETLSGGVAVNCGTLTLGAVGYPADLGANDIAIYAGATLEVVELKSDKCRQATVQFVDEPGFGAYGGITLPEGTTMCYKMRVNGVAQTRGTYGATGSGAQFIDDDHFTGPGILSVRSDDHQGFIILLR